MIRAARAAKEPFQRRCADPLHAATLRTLPYIVRTQRNKSRRKRWPSAFGGTARLGGLSYFLEQHLYTRVGRIRLVFTIWHFTVAPDVRIAVDAVA